MQLNACPGFTTSARHLLVFTLILKLIAKYSDFFTNNVGFISEDEFLINS